MVEHNVRPASRGSDSWSPTTASRPGVFSRGSLRRWVVAARRGEGGGSRGWKQRRRAPPPPRWGHESFWEWTTTHSARLLVHSSRRQREGWPAAGCECDCDTAGVEPRTKRRHPAGAQGESPSVFAHRSGTEAFSRLGLFCCSIFSTPNVLPKLQTPHF